MPENLFAILKERGFVDNVTHEEELGDLLKSQVVTGYIGFDPTANSLHVGSLVPIMSLVHMQRAGHRPIALVGGGTGLVGDPSGKTEMRKILTLETVKENVEGIRGQLDRFLGPGKAIMVNNADWLCKLNYIEFLRDYGRHFSVNRMIKAESYRLRLESDEGLSFIEFNYMCLQSYDFVHLNKEYGCRLQMGGADQWGNIVSGVDLVRRECGEQVFGITFPLITTASGAKMGKTAAGAVWLDPERTSPYDYYQFWINTHDADVGRFLALFTLLPMEEIRQVADLTGADLNAAKTVLAYEATRLAHGEGEAMAAWEAAVRMFGARPVPKGLLPSSSAPRDGSDNIPDDQEAAGESTPATALDASLFEKGLPAFELFFLAGLAGSKGATRRLLEQGGGYINGQRLESFDSPVMLEHFQDGSLVLRAGKKRYHRITLDRA